jgi:3-oxoacyl-[acyl-carrier-protein] synthase-1
MVTSVGLNAAATCAAIRAGVRNVSESRFVAAGSDPLMAAQVPLPKPWRGRAKLTQMLLASIAECVEPLPQTDRHDLALLLCLSEETRPGRPDDLEANIVADLERTLGLRFARGHSEVFSVGRAGGLIALKRARELIAEGAVGRVLIAGVDSLLVGRSIAALEDEDRLLTADNSNGFIPGEAAGCVMVAAQPGGMQSGVLCVGIGVADERVTIYSDEPFRADGLTRAVSSALQEAATDLAACGVRITDLSGEHYYFREAALSLSRLLRREGCRHLWHPAECIGEVGAAIGPILIGYAAAAAEKKFLPGPYVMVQSSSDHGPRAAACLAISGGPLVQ